MKVEDHNANTVGFAKLEEAICVNSASSLAESNRGVTIIYRSAGSR